MVQPNLVARGYRYLQRRLREWQRPEARALRQLKRSIGSLPRYQPGRVKVWGWDLEFVDSASCISGFDYIVVRRWNDFETENPQPYILDCGANIGISVLHYKRLFPNATIVAFEPDPQVCTVLRRNLRVNGATDVEVVEAALWDTEGEMPFGADRADGGRLEVSDGSKTLQLVKTQRLVEYLNQPVDLLKMDIEGAEGHVIPDCSDHLQHVKNITIEYHAISGREQDLHKILGTLAENGLRYFINSYGNWITLIRPPVSDALSIQQYVLISATRSWSGA